MFASAALAGTTGGFGAAGGGGGAGALKSRARVVEGPDDLEGTGGVVGGDSSSSSTSMANV